MIILKLFQGIWWCFRYMENSCQLIIICKLKIHSRFERLCCSHWKILGLLILKSGHFLAKKTATKWRMRKYTELPEDYLQTSWIVSVLIKIPCIYMILWLILPGKDIRHNQNNLFQKNFCNSKIDKIQLNIFIFTAKLIYLLFNFLLKFG